MFPSQERYPKIEELHGDRETEGKAHSAGYGLWVLLRRALRASVEGALEAPLSLRWGLDRG